MTTPANANAIEPQKFSLADFFIGDGDDPLVPPEDYAAWRRATAWETSLYEPALQAGPIPRTRVRIGTTSREVINLASYNYLGLARHPETIAAAKRALDDYGTGACGSPVLSGMTDLHRELEAELAGALGRESAMLFNSGFSGALGTLSGLLRKGDVAILDEKAHLCLIDGVRLSGARVELFAHNDPIDLDRKLSKTEGARRVVVVEGIYSMDGDIADLPALLAVTEAHDVGVMIDEAHSIFVLGDNGRGLAETIGAENRIRLQYGTFSKALASCGGFVAGPRETLQYARFYANPYAFSCALPPPVVASVLAGIRVVRREGAELRERLHDNASYFRAQLRSLGVDTGHSTTQVVPIVIGSDRGMLYQLGHQMLERGLFMAPVDYPSVPEDQVRFRASVTAAHTRADLDQALGIIESTVVKYLRSRR